MSLFEDVFCVHPVGADVWQFEVDERFNGAFGGTNGGVAAAISLYAARDGSDVLAAAAIDCHFLKSCRPGRVTVRRRILNQGRTLTVVATETEDHEHRICTTALVTLVDRNALANHVSFAAERHVARGSPDQAMPWKHPKGARIPLIDTFLPEIVGANSDTTTTRIQLPFETRRATAEAACIAADISVGPPVGRAVAGRASLPNPNLALRFSGTPADSAALLSQCRLAVIHAGMACTEIAVSTETALIGVGVSMTTCLPITARS